MVIVYTSNWCCEAIRANTFGVFGVELPLVDDEAGASVAV